MAESVDLARAVHFDLPNGSVQLGDDAHAVLLPSLAFAELLRSVHGDVRNRIGRSVGDAMGKRVAKRLGGADGVLSASLEATATHLAAELALSGFGQLALERWGRALVFHIATTNVDVPDFFLGWIEGAVVASTGRTAVGCALLSTASGIRILVSSEASASRVRKWIDQSVSWSDALVRLQGEGAA
jgi:hypothetical protein